jgi:hypothetical protein
VDIVEMALHGGVPVELLAQIISTIDAANAWTEYFSSQIYWVFIFPKFF